MQPLLEKIVKFFPVIEAKITTGIASVNTMSASIDRMTEQVRFTGYLLAGVLAAILFTLWRKK